MGGVSSTWASGVTSTTNTGIYMDGTGVFRVGESVSTGDNFIYYDGSTIQMKSTNYDLNASTIRLQSVNGGNFALGSSIPSNLSSTGIFLSGSGEFNLQKDGSNYIRQAGSTFQIKSSDLDINASGVLRISGSSAGAAIRMGSSGGPTGVTDTSNSGVFMDHTGKWAFVQSSNAYIRYDSALEIKTPTLELDTANIEISSTHASMSLGSANDINLDGVNKKITIGSANAVTIQGGSVDNFMVMGTKEDFSDFDQSTQGIIFGMDSTVPKFEIAGDSSNYISFNGSSLDIKAQTFELDATTIMIDSVVNDGTIMVGDADGQRIVISGSSGELAFFTPENSQSMRLLTRTEQTSYVAANGSAIISFEKAVAQDMTNGRLSINGSIAHEWDDAYTTSSFEGGKLKMIARQDDSLTYSATSQKLAQFHISGSIISTAGGATTAISASSINSGFGNASGVTVGSVSCALIATGVKVSGVTSTGTIAASFMSEGVSGVGGSNRTLALYATETGGNIIIGSGSASEPAYGFVSDRDTGFFLVSSLGNIGVSIAGTEEFRFATDGHFHADNNITAYSSTVSSDIRLKENIKPLEDNLDKILKLKPSSFTWKVRDKQDDAGLIAQEVEKVIPIIVEETVSIGHTKEFLDGDTHKTVDYAKLTTFLIGAVQEQQNQIDELKKKFEEL